MTRPRLTFEAYVDGVRRADRGVLARAITLVESRRPEDAELAAAVLDALLPAAGGAHRVGITGVPGVGKSTFIDALGMHLITERGLRVAVLSVDPSSPVSGGSILGDKTRMERLALEARAYVRPSPTGGVLGGVARHTPEAILLCEAAGFDVVLIETVGVGQSETAVRAMTDFFLLLLLPGAGDHLQGIKRGIVEMVDAVAVNKADGEQVAAAARARAEYQAALRLLASDGWRPPVMTCSALHGEGMTAIWDVVQTHRAESTAAGRFEARRRSQALAWMHGLVRDGLDATFRAHPAVAEALPALEADVAAGRTTPFAAARALLATTG
jgi:LAO/AO transport system kinase